MPSSDSGQSYTGNSGREFLDLYCIMGYMSFRLRAGTIVMIALMCLCVEAQVIDFESGGLKYQTLSKDGVTVMFAHLPSHVRDYAVVQAAISNGSTSPRMVRAENFVFRRTGGSAVRALPAGSVVDTLLDRASRNDVIRLVAAYESGLYGIPRFNSTNGYEQRRQAALAEVHSTRLKAAAAASAIAFVDSRLQPGDSTDGAIFFPTSGKPLGRGVLVVRLGNDVFEFPTDGGSAPALQTR